MANANALNHLIMTTNIVADTAFMIRFGNREISLSKDFRKRFYKPNPLIECRAGVCPGHVEVLLLRHWLVVFSMARN